jgi:glycosyltransferase involved in cell wall biosynthesis
VVHNAVDPREVAAGTPAEEIRRQCGLQPEHRVIGVVGRLSPEKGQAIFLRALEKVRDDVPGVRALIIGDGQDRPMLETFCRERGLSDHVAFLGHRERIADYYQVLDLLVLPSLSEGLPNTVLEAMSFAVPVLATAVGGVREIIDDGNGVVVPANDPQALAERMIGLLRDDALRRTIGLKGRESLYPRFAADGRARRIVGLYDELLSGQLGTRTTSKPAW